MEQFRVSQADAIVLKRLRRRAFWNDIRPSVIAAIIGSAAGALGGGALSWIMYHWQ